MLKTIVNFIKWPFDNPNDPVKHCEVYKNEGCSHVDGFLCYFPECKILKDYRKRQRMVKLIIVDIDGTITKVGDRVNHLSEKPCNWDAFYERCNEDEPVEPIIDLIVKLWSSGTDIVFITGRRESTRFKTKVWIDENMCKGLDYKLYMRKDGDFRHDTLIKPELIEAFFIESGLSKEDVSFILEDRNSMVKKWRELGYTCLQVADGDF